MQAFFNYLLVDQPELGRWQSGLLWADRTPKRSYEAFKQAAAEASADRTDCNALKGGTVARPDVVAPGRVTGVAGRPGPAQVSLRWAEPSENDVMGHHVYRSASREGPFMRVTSSPVPSASFTDRGLANGRTYWYAVSAVDTAENEGTRSDPVCATPRRNVERYPATQVRSVRGTMGRPRSVVRLYRNDGARIVVTAAGRRTYRASVVTKLRLPSCLAPPRTLRLEIEAAATAAGLPVEVFVLTRRETWGPAARASSSRRDRALVGTTRIAALWIRNGEVRVQVRVTGRSRFRASLDLLRLVARS